MQAGIAVRLGIASLLALGAANADTPLAQADYARFCSGCHGATFSISTRAEGEARSRQEIAAVIRGGNTQRGMPAFGGQIPDARIRALAEWLDTQATNGASLGATIAAETLDQVRSSGFVLMRAAESSIPYVGYFGERSSLCYPNVDLTGVRSIELNYAKGSDEAGRFAVLAGDGAAQARINLGEQATRSTGAWDAFQPRRIGLAQSLSGRRELCFYGVSGGGIFNLDSFTLSGEPGSHDGFTLALEDATPTAFDAAGYRVVLEKVADAPSELWAIAFLPDGSLIATQKSGQLLMFKEGRRVGYVEG